MRATKLTQEEEKTLQQQIEKNNSDLFIINGRIFALNNDLDKLAKQRTTPLLRSQQGKIFHDLQSNKDQKRELENHGRDLLRQLLPLQSENIQEPKANLTQKPPENVATVVVIPIEIPLPFQDKKEPSETLSEECIGEIKELMATPTKEKSPVAAAAVVAEIKITTTPATTGTATTPFQTPGSPTPEVSSGISDAKQPIQPSSINTREPDANPPETVPAIHKTAPFSRDQIRNLLKTLPHATTPITDIIEVPIVNNSPVSKKFWDVSKKIETGSFLFFIAAGTTFSMIEKWGSTQSKYLDAAGSFAQNNPTMTLFGSGLISAVALSQLWRAMFSLCHDGQNKSMITSSETTSESEKSKMESQLIKVAVFITCMACLLVPLQFYLDHKASAISNTIGNAIKNASAGYFLLIQPVLALNFSLLTKLGYEMGRYALSKCRATSLSPESPVGQRRDSQLSAVSMQQNTTENTPLL